VERVPVGLENFQVQHSDPIEATSALTCVSSALDLGGPRGLRSPSRLRLRSTAEDEQWEHAEGENRDPMRPHRSLWVLSGKHGLTSGLRSRLFLKVLEARLVGTRSTQPNVGAH